MTERLRIAVLGYIVRGPLGGLAWHHLQYVLGLARMGHDVYFLEDSDDYPSCYDPERFEVGTDPSYGLRFADRAFRRVGLGERWGYHDAHSGRWMGPRGRELLRTAGRADVVLNVSGVNLLRPWLAEIPVRVLVDTDPVFTQIRHLTDPEAAARAAAHTHFFTFGENMGRGAEIPDDGLPWRTTRQPVVLDAWPVTPGPTGGRFTTVMQWESYPAREHEGRRYGMKSESLRRFIDLPSNTEALLEVALGSDGAPREELREHGWLVRDPLEPTRDPWTYQRYIAGSKGELTVAKHGYVVSRSGWFSERSAAYLASGRPVVAQDTGFSDWLPTGRGVLAFDTLDEARDAIGQVEREYEKHCRGAREIVEASFDSAAVLSALLEELTGPVEVAG